jgi:hypothetical protein
VFGALAWAWLDLGLAYAAGVPPTNPATLMLNTSSQVTVSLYQLDSGLPSTIDLQSPSRCVTTGTSFYKDVTDCWLPEWSPASGGKSVYVVVNGAPDTPVLVPPAGPFTFPGTTNPFLTALTTSAYPGQCTNFGSGTQADFTLASSPTPLQTSPTTSVPGYLLTPSDCGGMAVIQVGTLKFVVPRDGTATVPANGIPEVWESLYGGNLNPGLDTDTGPVGSSLAGDGISTFDEYRGFIVSGRQIRTDPTQKDIFLHVVNPADSVGGAFVTSRSCGTSCYGGGTTTYPAPTAPSATLTVPATAATVGGIATFTTSTGVFSVAHVRGEIIGNAGGRARITAVTGPASATAEITQAFPAGNLSAGAWKVSESLFALAYTLVAPERVHLLGSVPGATNFLTNEWVDNFVSLIPSQTLNISDSVTDRTVNANRLYGPAQKGVRVMEGLNLNSPSLLGFSFGVASPNDAGNVVVFTQRIIDYIESLLVGATTIKYSTTSLVNGVLTWGTPILAPDGDPTVNQDGVATNPGVRNFILSKAFQFYTGHEIQHSLDLTPDVQGTTRVTYGHHYPPGTGDCLDQAITITSKSGTVTFSIPSVCGTADQAQFLIH